MHILELTKIGDSLGVVLPDEVLAGLKLKEGGSIFLTEAPEGYAIARLDPAVEPQLTAVQRIMAKRCNALRELAK